MRRAAILPFLLVLAAQPSCRSAAAQASVASPTDRALVERGAKLYAKCQACHSLEPNGRNKVGPRLSGLFGRISGGVPDYQYSDALKKARIRWTAETLDVFLAGTTEMVPGTKMYAGMARAEDRRALIAFLERATKP